MSMRWSEEEYMEYLERAGKQTARQKLKRKQKYNAEKTWVDGICFDSAKEARMYQDLKILQAAGEIKGFCRQPEFILVDGNEKTRAITYKADFIVFWDDGRVQIIDTKGYETKEWKRTEKLFKLRYPELEIRVIKEV